jgi:hypothetical protein
LRDRRAWRTKQADRLREAGFGEGDIERWERTAKDGDGDGGVDLNLTNVKWRRKGEEREWDAGKTATSQDP